MTPHMMQSLVLWGLVATTAMAAILQLSQGLGLSRMSLTFLLGSASWDFWELLWPQIFRGVGLMIAFIPINNIALGTLPPERVKNTSASTT
jgi:hypothetical protein